MAPSRLHPLSVVHFQSTLFQTKGQNLIVPVVSFFLRCHPVRPTRPGCPYSLLDLQRSLIGSLASFRHNHFLVTLRTLSPLLPSANYASRVALRQRKRKRVRRYQLVSVGGVGGSMNGRGGGGGGSGLSWAPGPGPGAARGPRRCMGSARGP